MGGGGGGTSSDSGLKTSSPYEVDQGKLIEFMNSRAGKPYATMFDPGNSYRKVGDQIVAVKYKPGESDAMPDTYGQQFGMDRPSRYGTDKGTDVTQLMTAYNAWAAGDSQSKNNWDSYAKAVAGNSGGEGDNTITSGAAVSQRNDLLGVIAAGGNTTQPTPGLGVFGGVRPRLGTTTRPGSK